ncbi:MAG TPA: hypothetical protein VIG45_06190 [Erysipelothrix sp.]
MNINPRTQAILLLTAHFSVHSTTTVEPLSSCEWGELSAWLIKKQLVPENLLVVHIEDVLLGWEHSNITIERIRILLNRGASLGLALNRWLQSGIWIITRADIDYPIRLKKLLGLNAPPVLFGCGNRKLLNTQSITIVNENEAEYLLRQDIVTTEIREKSIPIVYGLDNEVSKLDIVRYSQIINIIGIVPKKLLSVITHSSWRAALLGGNIVVISTSFPEAEMCDSNDYMTVLHSLSSATLILSSKKDYLIDSIMKICITYKIPLWLEEGVLAKLSRNTQANQLLHDTKISDVFMGKSGKQKVKKLAIGTQLELF